MRFRKLWNIDVQKIFIISPCAPQDTFKIYHWQLSLVPSPSWTKSKLPFLWGLCCNILLHWWRAISRTSYHHIASRREWNGKGCSSPIESGWGLRENKRKTQTKKKRLSAEETTLCDANDGTCACGPESLKSARPDQLLDGWMFVASRNSGRGKRDQEKTSHIRISWWTIPGH